MGIPMNIAITDAATHLLHFSRMDGAKITSINIAIDKAFTASGHRIGTHLYKEAVRDADLSITFVSRLSSSSVRIVVIWRV
jgi:uncharacterized protein GlcG (DUF336 family)